LHILSSRVLSISYFKGGNLILVLILSLLLIHYNPNKTPLSRERQSTGCLPLPDMGCRLIGKTSEFDSEKRSSNLLSPV
jgi:hypothetical protein